MSVCCIDIEASSLEPGGFPIQVAWSLPSGAVCSAVIKPEPSWLEAGEWDPIAEELHGLSGDALAARGAPPRMLALRLNRGLCDHVVYSDALAYDQAWIDQLFDAARVKRQFQLADAMQLIAARLGEPACAGVHWYESLLAAATRRRPELRPHCAADDVRLLHEILGLAEGCGDPEQRFAMRRK